MASGEPVVDGKAHWAEDVKWAYEQFGYCVSSPGSDGRCEVDLSKSSRPPPSRTAVTLLEQAVEDKASRRKFLNDIVPKVYKDEDSGEISEAAVEAYEKQIVEMRRVLKRYVDLASSSRARKPKKGGDGKEEASQAE